MSDVIETSQTRREFRHGMKTMLRPAVTLVAAATMLFTLAVPAHAAMTPQRCPGLVLTTECLPAEMDPFVAMPVGAYAFARGNTIVLVVRAALLSNGPYVAYIDDKRIRDGRAVRADSGDTLILLEFKANLSVVIGHIFRLRANGTVVFLAPVGLCPLPQCS